MSLPQAFIPPQGILLASQFFRLHSSQPISRISHRWHQSARRGLGFLISARNYPNSQLPRSFNRTRDIDFTSATRRGNLTAVHRLRRSPRTSVSPPPRRHPPPPSQTTSIHPQAPAQQTSNSPNQYLPPHLLTTKSPVGLLTDAPSSPSTKQASKMCITTTEHHYQFVAP